MPEVTAVPEPTPVAADPAAAPVAVVSGASRGIGAHLARAFHGAGYALEGCSQSGATPPGLPSGSLAAVDVTEPAAVAAWVAEILARRGRIDVLVNNAGVLDTEVGLEESDPQEWWRTVEVNVRGPYLLTRMVLPGMLAAGAGRIININSGAGTKPGAVASAYHVGKTALGRLTGSTHLSGAGRGVVAFDLAPGVVRTDMTGGMAAHADRTEWTEPAQVCALALALAGGGLDAWSGRMVRAGVDTAESLAARARAGLTDRDRTVGLLPWGADDPLA